LTTCLKCKLWKILSILYYILYLHHKTKLLTKFYTYTKLQRFRLGDDGSGVWTSYFIKCVRKNCVHYAVYNSVTYLHYSVPYTCFRFLSTGNWWSNSLVLCPANRIQKYVQCILFSRIHGICTLCIYYYNYYNIPNIGYRFISSIVTITHLSIIRRGGGWSTPPRWPYYYYFKIVYF